MSVVLVGMSAASVACQQLVKHVSISHKFIVCSTELH
jgi:hypothetical protein